MSWIDRCLGTTQPVMWTGDMLTAAAAAATLALDGTLTWPVVRVESYSPAAQAEVDTTIAMTALATGRDHDAVDRAFVTADGVAGNSPRDRVLRWGALELRARGDARAARWAAAIRDADFRHEVAAHDVRLCAEAGDFAAARAALAKLPPMWGVMSGEAWPDHPRWLGSAAAASAVALTSPAVAAAPGARDLVGEAERMTAQITEDWRQNRELRILAMAWARAGELERALAATSRMPGSERARAIAGLLDGFGDAPGVDLARIVPQARAAIAATRSAPFVLSDGPRGDIDSFIADAVSGEVTAAIVRRHLARGELDRARAAVVAIPTNLSSHHEAALQLACARLARGETTVEAIVSGLPEYFRDNLLRAALEVGSLDVAAAMVHLVRFGHRIIANTINDAIHGGRLTAAAGMLRALWGRVEFATMCLAALVGKLVQTGRIAEAHALWQDLSAGERSDPLRAAGHRLVIGLVLTRQPDAARAVHREL
jgi:hypothetical protein